MLDPEDQKVLDKKLADLIVGFLRSVLGEQTERIVEELRANREEMVRLRESIALNTQSLQRTIERKGKI